MPLAISYPCCFGLGFPPVLSDHCSRFRGPVSQVFTDILLLAMVDPLFLPGWPVLAGSLCAVLVHNFLAFCVSVLFSLAIVAFVGPLASAFFVASLVGVPNGQAIQYR